MSKAVLIKNGQTTFLMETDPSVQIPPEMAIAIASHIPGIPKDMQPVVSLESLEGNFTAISDLIVACSNSLFAAITKIQKPDKVTVEFGIKLAGEGGSSDVDKGLRRGKLSNFGRVDGFFHRVNCLFSESAP